MIRRFSIFILLLITACNEPDPQIQTQIDGLKQDVVSLSGWVDTLAVRQESMFGRTEQLETANAELVQKMHTLEVEDVRQDSELSSISGQLESWNIDSQRVVRELILAHTQAIARIEALIDSLKGPKGTPDSLGNICYEVEPDQTFRYFLYHNFKDTLGNYEEGIKYHTAIEAYRTVADLYTGRQYDKSSLDYQWHDYNYARFKDVAILTKDGLVLRLPVNIILPYRNMYYVIAHAVIDRAGKESDWNRSIKEGYYVHIR